MLYVFHGTNNKKVADQTLKLVTNLLIKKPNAQVYHFEEGEVNENELDSLIEAQGLFVEKHIVVLKQTFQKTESREIVLPKLVQFKETQNIFIISEGKLSAEHKKELKKYAEKIEEHTKEKIEEKSYNVFELTDALGSRDKKTLWIGYIKALESGVELENIHGTLHWALKAMIAAKKSERAEDSGEKPFTYNKYKRYSNNFLNDELVFLSRKLIELYHEARRGKYELSIALERWILGI